MEKFCYVQTNFSSEDEPWESVSRDVFVNGTAVFSQRYSRISQWVGTAFCLFCFVLFFKLDGILFTNVTTDRSLKVKQYYN